MTDQPAPARLKKRRLAWIAALAILVVIAGVFFGSRMYANSVAAQAEAVPTLTASPSGAAASGTASSEPASTTVDTSGTWTVESGSYAGYRLDEVLNGADVTVTGRTEEVSGSLSIENDKLTAANLSLQVASIATDSARRDSYFRNSAINTAQHPEATFTLTSPVDISAVGTGNTRTFSITGDLTINGQTTSVSADVQGAYNDGAAQLVGQIPVSWADFGVKAPNLGFVSVEDSGFIEFSLNVTRN